MGGGSSPPSDTQTCRSGAISASPHERFLRSTAGSGNRRRIATQSSQRAERPETRFWSRVQQGRGCWEWQGARGADGYGALRWEGRSERSHRVAWLLTNGPIPDRHNVLQSCTNRACCRPEHLQLRAPTVDDPVARAKVARRRSAKSVAGRGHLEQRAPDGWRLVVYRGRDPETGRMRYERPSFRGTEEDAQVALARLIVDMAEAGFELDPRKLSVGEVLDLWYQQVAPERFAALRVRRPAGGHGRDFARRPSRSTSLAEFASSGSRGSRRCVQPLPSTLNVVGATPEGGVRIGWEVPAVPLRVSSLRTTPRRRTVQLQAQRSGDVACPQGTHRATRAPSVEFTALTPDEFRAAIMRGELRGTPELLFVLRKMYLVGFAAAQAS